MKTKVFDSKAQRACILIKDTTYKRSINFIYIQNLISELSRDIPNAIAGDYYLHFIDDHSFAVSTNSMKAPDGYKEVEDCFCDDIKSCT